MIRVQNALEVIELCGTRLGQLGRRLPQGRRIGRNGRLIIGIDVLLELQARPENVTELNMGVFGTELRAPAGIAITCPPECLFRQVLVLDLETA